jgi:hypothetical protein
MTTDVSQGGRPPLTQDEILDPNYDYHAPLDPIETVPPMPILQQSYSLAVRRCRFLHALQQGHSATWSARYAGIDHAQVYRHKQEYPSFAAAWASAVEFQAGDIWEDRLHAISQSDKHLGAAVTATIVGLKMRKRFVENAPVGNQPVQVQIINVVRGETTNTTTMIDNVPARAELPPPAD